MKVAGGLARVSSAALALAALAGCAALPVVRLPVPPLTLETLRHAEYDSAWAGTRIRLARGVWSEPGDGSGLRVSLLERWAPGDLDADGEPDAAAVLLSDPGGSGVFVDLVAVLGRRGRPLHVATAHLGDRVRVETVAVERGVVLVRLMAHAPGDPLCCPTRNTLRRFRLSETELVPAD